MRWERRVLFGKHSVKTAARSGRVFTVHFDDLAQVFDSERREGHDTLVIGAIDPNDPIFGAHIDGKIK